MTLNRHAYLILVHNQPRLLQVLIDMIDDSRNDIYIHVDANADINQFATIHAEKSNLYYTERIHIYWGNDSIIYGQNVLLKTAHKNGPYLYYHFLSGVDLPLKSQDYIHNFMDVVHRGYEFLGYSKNKRLEQRARYYYLFDRHLRSESIMENVFSKLRMLAIKIQKRLGVWRNKNVDFFWGPNWCSITDDLCKYILLNEKEIRNLYKMTCNSDESYIQTIVYGTSFQEKVFDIEDEYRSCLRLIEWPPNSSSPHTWSREDWSKLISSDRLFARKFTEDDMEFVNDLKEYVLSNGKTLN